MQALTLLYAKILIYLRHFARGLLMVVPFFHGNNICFCKGGHEMFTINHVLASRKIHFCAIDALQKYFFSDIKSIYRKKCFDFFSAVLWLKVISITFVC
jgi:hypothetical protein